MIIISDSHVSNETADEFFKMLEMIENTDLPVIFLGDIFDLWISIPRYEKSNHKKFLKWCKEQKNNRTIGVIEGNHEFFVAREHHNCFTWADKEEFTKDGIVYIHGDMINTNDKGYRLLRVLSKNLIMKAVFTYIPNGVKVIHWLEKKIGKINPKKRYKLPDNDINNFAKNRFEKNNKIILMGHFHQSKTYEFSDNRVFLLPDWYTTKKISYLDMDKRTIISDHYENILN
jgi:UDP-2,3-diacylglucosamine pyrophosphatase LpxH